jgi:hypothetical protein
MKRRKCDYNSSYKGRNTEKPLVRRVGAFRSLFICTMCIIKGTNVKVNNYYVNVLKFDFRL